MALPGQRLRSVAKRGANQNMGLKQKLESQTKPPGRHASARNFPALPTPPPPTCPAPTGQPGGGSLKKHDLSKCTASRQAVLSARENRGKFILCGGHSWKNICGAGPGQALTPPCERLGWAGVEVTGPKERASSSDKKARVQSWTRRPTAEFSFVFFKKRESTG